MSVLTFPVAVSQLSDTLPHRAPALWIDEVESIALNEGVCRVYLRTAAHYADARGRIRDSSFVEWIAQAYGFVAACQVLAGLAAEEKRPEKTFLAQVRDFELSVDSVSSLIVEGDWIRVRVKRTHRLGPLALVEGEVYSSNDVLLARAKLKLYAE